MPPKQPAPQNHDWNASNVLDDVEYHEHEARQFRDLLYGTEKPGGGETALSQLNAGQVLTGRIVEISKDYVVIDVGLKSEGLVPISEFTEPEELVLGGDIEVYLDQTEGEDGQIVLSREKARKFRQWEHIVKNCHEGSIVKGKVIRKVKGGLMVDIGMEAFLPGSQIDNKRIKNLDDFIGHTYDFKILKINIERKNIVVSRRELLEEESVSRKAELLENIKEGATSTRGREEHHRFRRIPRPRRNRWTSPYHRHDLEADQTSFRNGPPRPRDRSHRSSMSTEKKVASLSD